MAGSPTPADTCGPAVVTSAGKSDRSVVTIAVASALVSLKTLIWATSPGESSSRIKAATRSMLSAGAATISTFSRGSGAICTSPRIPDLMSFSPFGSRVSSSRAADFCAAPAAPPAPR